MSYPTILVDRDSKNVRHIGVSHQFQIQTQNIDPNVTLSSGLNQTNFTTVMTMTTGGNIGIGTTTPLAKTHIWANSGDQLRVGTASPFVVTSLNYVGVGTTNPLSSLHVFGSGNTEIGGMIQNVSTETNGLSIFRLRTSTTSDLVIFKNGTSRTTDGGVNTGTIRNDAGDLRVQARTGVGLHIKEVTGNIGIGTSDPRAKLHIIHSGTDDSFRVDDESGDTTPFIIDANGNVGIGTTNPGAKLQLETNGNIVLYGNNWNGAVRFGSTLTGANGDGLHYITRGGIDAWKDHLVIHTNSGSSTSGVNFATNSAVSRLFIKSSDGFVGIGTTLPFSALDVRGNQYVSGNVGIGTSNPSARLYITQTGTADAFRVEDESNDTSPFVINADGNVGIGTTIAVTRLHVQGTQFVSDNIGLGTSAPLAKLHVVQTSAVAALRVDDESGDTTPFIITDVGNVGIGTTIALTNLHVQGTEYISGSLGIGTTTPLSALHVNGTARATTFEGPLSGNATTATTLQTARTINNVSFNGSANITITANTTNTLTAGSYLSGGTFNGSAPVTFAVNASTDNQASQLVARDVRGNIMVGNVGIGTGTIAGTVHIQRSTANAVGPVLLIHNAGGTVGANTDTTSAIDFHNYTLEGVTGGNSARIAGVHDGGASSHITFSTKTGTTATGALTERMRILSGGNIGIGTTVATTLLDVNGNIKATGINITNPNGLLINGTSYTGVFKPIYIGGGTTYLDVYYENGVNIGSSSALPTDELLYKLNVEGNARVLEIKATKGFIGPGYKITKLLPSQLPNLATTGLADGLMLLYDFESDTKALNTTVAPITNRAQGADNPGNVGGYTEIRSFTTSDTNALFKFSKQLRLNSTGAYLKIGEGFPSNESDKHLAISFWHYITNVPASGSYNVLVSSSSTIAQLTLGYASSTSCILGHLRSGQSAPESLGFTLNTGRWYHIGLIIVNATTMNVFIDGAYIGNANIDDVSANTIKFIGNDGSTGTRCARGWYANVLIYQRLMSFVEMEQLYLMDRRSLHYTRNVGFGTTTPVQQVHVEGTQYISANLGIGTTSPLAKLHILQTDTDDALRVDDGANDVSPFVIKADGNVGIATANPTSTLMVIGSTEVRTDATNELKFPPAAMTANTTTINTTSYGRGTYIASASTSLNATTYAPYGAFNNTAGNTGAGTVWISGQNYAATEGGAYTGGNGILGYSGDHLQIQMPKKMILKSFKIRARNDPTSRGDPRDFRVFGSNDGNTWTQLFDITGESFTQNQEKEYTVTTSTAFSFYSIVVNKKNTLTTYVAIAEWSLYGVYDNYLLKSSDDMILIDTNINVGIGTTNPVSALDVSGSIHLTNNIDLDGQILGYQSDSFNTPTYTWSGNTGTGMFLPIANTIGFTINQSEAVRINSSRNVGIGTDSPLSRLHVFGASGTLFQYSDGTRTIYGGCDANDGWFGTSTAHTLRLRTSGGDRVYVTTAGDVGIGVTVPTAKLHISAAANTKAIQVNNALGNRRVVLWEGADNDHEFYGLGINSGTLRYQVSGTTANHIFYASTSSSASTELMRIEGTGQVGINTANALTTLHVGGDQYISGNLGIGKTNPSIPLHVEGNAYVSTNIGIGTLTTTASLDVFDVGIGRTDASMVVRGTVNRIMTVRALTPELQLPPSMNGNNTYTSTYSLYSGNFVASSSTNFSGSVAWNAFTGTNTTFWKSSSVYTTGTLPVGTYSGTLFTKYFTTGNSGTSSDYLGEWIQILLPVSIVPTKITITPHTSTVGTARTYSIFGTSASSINTNTVFVRLATIENTDLLTETTHTFADTFNQRYRAIRVAVNAIGQLASTSDKAVVIGNISVSGHVVDTTCVGIGTTLPRTSFDVFGDMNVERYATVTGVGHNLYNDRLWRYQGTGFGHMISFNETDGNMYFASTLEKGNVNGTASLSNWLVITSTGNIGIGTTIGHQRMHVEGNTYVSGNVGIGTTIPRYNLHVQGTQYVSGSVGIGTTQPVSALHVQGTITASSIVGPVSGIASSATKLETARTINNVAFDGTQNITLTANTTNMLTAGTGLSGGTFNGSSAVTFTVDSSSTNTVNKVVARDAQGNIAVGNISVGNSTSTPSNGLIRTFDLRVHGNLYKADDTTPITSSQWKDATNLIYYGIASAEKVGIGTDTPQQKLEVSGKMIVNASLNNNANIGIGTTNPGAKLHLYQTASGEVSRLSYFSTTERTITTGFLSDRGYVGTSSGHLFSLRANNTDHLHITTAGSIGIGTTTPSQALQVQGSVYATSQYLGLAGDTEGAPSFTWNGDTDTGMFRAGANIIAFATNATEKVRIEGNGDVGIGTTIATQKLHVEGSIYTSTKFLGNINDTDAAPSFTWNGDVDTGMFRAGTNILGFTTSGSERLRILANGNVGIGSQTPTQLLDVSGTVRATAFSGNGASISALHAPNISSGQLNVARLPTAIGVSTTTYTGTSATLSGAVTAGSFSGTNATISGTLTLSQITVPDTTLEIERDTTLDLSFNVNNINALGSSTLRLQLTSIADNDFVITKYNSGHPTEAYNTVMKNFKGKIVLEGVAVGTNPGGVHVVGTLTASVDVQVTSDRRYKTDIRILADALSKLRTLNGYTFIKTSDETKRRQCGLIAQEVQAVLPEAVTVNEHGYLTLSYGNMIALVIQAMKELEEKHATQMNDAHQYIHELQNRVAELEAQNARMTQDLDMIKRTLGIQ